MSTLSLHGFTPLVLLTQRTNSPGGESQEDRLRLKGWPALPSAQFGPNRGAGFSQGQEFSWPFFACFFEDASILLQLTHSCILPFMELKDRGIRP